VYSSYLQYVELGLRGAAVHRRRLAMPSSILRLGMSKEIEGRLRTTFDLIEKSSSLTSGELESDLKRIRNDFTGSLGEDHGRVMLKCAKVKMLERLSTLRKNLDEHARNVASELQSQLDETKAQIVAYYLTLVMKQLPDAMYGPSGLNQPRESAARIWRREELARVFPTAESLVGAMQLKVRFKDITYETLKAPGFLDKIKTLFPFVDWKKAHEEFRAAGEAQP
jgi:hypothetical protein